MKRDELVRYDGEWYDANIVDCLLDEKDADIEALNRKYERMREKHMAEMVEAGKVERRLKRALYRACANWAHHRVFVRLNTNEKIWINMERKCRAKAEQYR